jgi:biotin carboxylase
MSDRRVLVVGTTRDYIAHIHERYPGRALFLTDSAQRIGSAETGPDHTSEVVCHLSDKDDVIRVLQKHLQETDQSLSGVACYDCEWLSLAAELAQYYNLPFPTTQAVHLSRDKFLTKRKWAEHGVRCPKVELVHNGWQTLHLNDRIGSSVVLKPTAGTGSELTFLCRDNYELTTAFRAIREGLIERGQSTLYNLNRPTVKRLDPGYPFMAEEFVEGREYSVDFIIDGDNLILIRVAKKLRDHILPFGTTMAYVVPAKLPGLLSRELLIDSLREAANVLGLTRAICMVDCIISKNEIVFLEMTPRIGGDCLPPLIQHSCGLDTIGLALDFAEGKACEIPPAHKWKEHIGLRLLSTQAGLLEAVSCQEFPEDSGVKEIFIKRAPGHEINLPPEDYDSWLLGHVIFESRTHVNHRRQCDDIRQKIFINVEQYHDQRLAKHHNTSRRVAPSPGPTA